MQGTTVRTGIEHGPPEIFADTPLRRCNLFHHSFKLVNNEYLCESIMAHFGKRIKPSRSGVSDEEDGYDDTASSDHKPYVLDTAKEAEPSGISSEDDDDDNSDNYDDVNDNDEGEDEERGGDDSDAIIEDKQRPDPHEQLRSIQFGTLAKAQDSLTRKRKRDSDTTPAHDEKLVVLRERLKELREQHAKKDAKPKPSKSRDSSKPDKTKTRSKHDSDAEDDERVSSDSDSSPETYKAHKHSRSSKHAPQILSSNRQVSRNRVVVEPTAPRIKSRDPRFVNPTGAYDPNKVATNYKFLDDYKASELGDLKAQLANAKKSKLSADDKEDLKMRIAAEENRARARKAADRQQEVIREHRKTEKEAIKQGKKPFFLKKGEIKEQAQVKRYEGMKAKDRKRTMDKKQKKEGQKFKRAMPAARRFG